MATITSIINDIKEGRKPSVVTLVTHKPQPFHADETAATALLKILFEQFDVETFVHHTFNPEADGFTDDTPNVIIYDVGLGVYDHHQVAGQDSHCLREDPDGITRKYSSVGLIWREIGSYLVPEKYTSEIYDNFIRFIDDQDNGNGLNPMSYAIKNLNEPSNRKYNVNPFRNAVFIFTNLFHHMFESINAKAELEEEIDRLVNEAESTGKQYVVTDNFMVGMTEKLSHVGIPFYIYSNVRGGYCFRAISPEGGDMNEFIVPIPEETRGWKGVTFLHPNRFMGSAVDKDRAIEIVETILNDAK